MWSAERVDLLKKLWGEGLSASQIAFRLPGMTRNAVIGKIHRLGLSGRATPRRSCNVSRPRAPRASRLHPVPRQMQDFRFGAANPPASDGPELVPNTVPAVELGAPPSCLMLPIDKLTATTCRFPIGDPRDPGFGFCGCPKLPDPLVPYCAYHDRKTHEPVPAKRRAA